MRRQVGFLVGAIAVLVSIPAMAAPLVTSTLLGRVSGSGDPFSSVVVVPVVGATLDVQLVVDMAPIGTQNIQGATTRTITSLVVGQSGINNFKIDAKPEVTVLGNFEAPLTLLGGWATGIGASGGALSTAGLTGIRPVDGVAYAAIDPEVIATGTFTVLPGSGSGLVKMNWTSGGSGTMRINGSSSVLMSTTIENGADPMMGYGNLEIIVPEPASIGLLGLSLLGLVIRRR